MSSAISQTQPLLSSYSNIGANLSGIADQPSLSARLFVDLIEKMRDLSTDPHTIESSISCLADRLESNTEMAALVAALKEWDTWFEKNLGCDDTKTLAKHIRLLVTLYKERSGPQFKLCCEFLLYKFNPEGGQILFSLLPDRYFRESGFCALAQVEVILTKISAILGKRRESLIQDSLEKLILYKSGSYKENGELKNKAHNIVIPNEFKKMILPLMQRDGLSKEETSKLETSLKSVAEDLTLWCQSHFSDLDVASLYTFDRSNHDAWQKDYLSPLSEQEKSIIEFFLGLRNDIKNSQDLKAYEVFSNSVKQLVKDLYDKGNLLVAFLLIQSIGEDNKKLLDDSSLVTILLTKLRGETLSDTYNKINSSLSSVAHQDYFSFEQQWMKSHGFQAVIPITAHYSRQLAQPSSIGSLCAQVNQSDLFAHRIMQCRIEKSYSEFQRKSYLTTIISEIKEPHQELSPVAKKEGSNLKRSNSFMSFLRNTPLQGSLRRIRGRKKIPAPVNEE